MGAVKVVPDTPIWVSGFPSAELVKAAAGMFVGHRVPERDLGVTLLATSATGWDPAAHVANSKSRELWPDRFERRSGAEYREQVEGPRHWIKVAPGVVSVGATDPVRRDRTLERLVPRLVVDADGIPVTGWFTENGKRNGGAVVSEWSAKSRRRMVRVVAELDWQPMFAEPGTVPAMVTLTYPGDWRAVAPHAEASRRHLLLLRKRFERAWKRPMIAVWKREFQRRGAVHYHLLMAPPHGTVQLGSERVAFPAWLSRVWADIVNAERCSIELPCDSVNRCEYHRHLLAGTGVDYSDGLKCSDPRQVGRYFLKHGLFSAKDYQNVAPKEWVDAGSVGRFWGVWGLHRAVAGTVVHHEEAIATARLLRRYSRANAPVVEVEAWRYRTTVDGQTRGVRDSDDLDSVAIGAKWRKVTKRRRAYIRIGSAGFYLTSNGPALAASIARYLDGLRRPQQVIGRSGVGSPIGFLP